MEDVRTITPKKERRIIDTLGPVLNQPVTIGEKLRLIVKTITSTIKQPIRTKLKNKSYPPSARIHKQLLIASSYS